VANLSVEASDAETKLCVTYARTVDSRDLEAWIMGEVIVKYKVNLDEDGQGRIDGIVGDLTGLPPESGAVQHVEKKPLAFGMMFVEVQVVIQDGEGHLDRFEEAVMALSGVSNLETLELGRL
jgi:translation elongation factor EF-1beta